MGTAPSTTRDKHKQRPIHVKYIRDLKSEIQDVLKPIGNLHTNFVTEIKRDAQHDYEKIKDLGGGKMGQVYTAVRRIIAVTGYEERAIQDSSSLVVQQQQHHQHHQRLPVQYYAIKQAAISKQSAHFLECLRKEIRALKSLDHPNIVKPYYVYTPRKNVQLVFQFCSGGNLYSRYPLDTSSSSANASKEQGGGNKIPYSERDTARIVTQLLSAVAHMHAHGFTHRDIKFENIIFESPHPEAEIKLIDFGLAQDIDTMVECCGTTYTMAREVLTLKGYTNKVDIWSVGVIVYMMLSLTKPFYGRNKMIITNKIMKGDFRFYSPRWETVSDDAKNFIEALMEKDPQKRLSAVQALDHIWFKKQYLPSERNVTEQMWQRVLKSFKLCTKYNILKRVALLIMAHHATTEDVRELKRAFDFLDRKKIGQLDFRDFSDGMKMLDPSCSNDDIRSCFHGINIHHDGKIRYSEFLAVTLELEGCITYDSLEMAFQRLDTDLSGYITRENLKEIMGSDYKYYEVDKVWNVNNYGEQITFDEFIDIVVHKVGPQSNPTLVSKSQSSGSFKYDSEV